MKKSLFFAVLVLFGGAATQAQTYFEDDFNGTSLTANNNWLIYNVISNSFNHEWFHNVFSGNGRARVTNYNNATEINEELESWLITPAISLADSESPEFYFDNTKRFAGDDIALFVSTDYDGTSDPSSGFTWDNLTAEANFDGNAGSWDMVPSAKVDLSAYNGQTIYIAFKYYGSNSNGSTYQIDNIVLEEAGTTGNCADGIFCDDFNGGSLTANVAWEVVEVIPSASNLKWRYGSFEGNGRAEVSNFFNSVNEPMESWLISPAIDLSTYTDDLILTFDNTKRFAGGEIWFYISTDYDGGGDPTNASFTWSDHTGDVNWDTNIESWTSTVSSGDVDLSQYGGSTIYIAYKYVGGDSDGSTYRIDNVLLKETSTPTYSCDEGIFCDDFNGGSLTANVPWQVVEVVPSASNLKWRYGSFEGNGRAEVSNFIGGVNEPLESWLISPAIDLTDYTDQLTLTFDNTKRFEGGQIWFYISTDYNGGGNPTEAAFTWTDYTNAVNWDNNIDSWFSVSSGNIDLSEYGGSTIYIAYKYVGGASDGSSYRIDNVLLKEFVAPELTSIFDIQFTTATDGASPLAGEVVTTTGIVTAVAGNGYTLQDGTGPWNGIQIYNPSNTPSLGDSVVVTGTVEEYFGMTQIGFVSAYNVASTGNSLPAPTVINTNQANEPFESVLVRLEELPCTNADAGFGMWTISDGTGSLLVDDRFYKYETPLQGKFYTVTGVINFAFGAFRISPRFVADVDELASTNSYVSTPTLSIYPNPAIESITVKGLANEPVVIIDLLGNKIMHLEIKSDAEKIDVSSLHKGAYILQSNKGNQKFIKQ